MNSYIDGKLAVLDFERIGFLKDTQDKAFFFYENGFVEITKNGIELKPYKELSGYIWKSQIIEHDFVVMKDDEENRESLNKFSFNKFVRNTCTKRNEKDDTLNFDNKRYNALVCIIGYLLHNYKITSNLFATLLTESNLDINTAKGGTGKGLLMQGVGKLRKTTVIDGKNFSFDSQFAFQNVEMDTQILFFDDVKKYFDFERLYSTITEGISFERKNRDRIKRSPEDSPKVVISTNTAIIDNSGSAKRRKKEMELECYYSDKFSPLDEFKEPFFYSWNQNEWNIFYNFMLSCIESYFNKSLKIPEYDSTSIEEKKLITATSQDFVKFANHLSKNTDLVKGTTFADFDSISTKDITPKKFNLWLKAYCNHHRYELIEHTINKERCFMIKDTIKGK